MDMLIAECLRHLVKVCILQDDVEIVLTLHQQREHSLNKGMIIVNVRQNGRRNPPDVLIEHPFLLRYPIRHSHIYVFI